MGGLAALRPPLPARYDAALTSAVLDLFVRAVFASLRRRARRQRGVARGQGGAVTFVQRFGDALNLNVHFHSLVLDGIYAPGHGGAPSFHPLPPPDDAEVSRVAAAVARRLAHLLERRGLAAGVDPTEAARWRTASPSSPRSPQPAVGVGQ